MESKLDTIRRGLQETRGPGMNDTWSTEMALRPETPGSPPDNSQRDEHALIEELVAENQELRRQLAELAPPGAGGSAGELTEQMWVERQREYEVLLEEKSEVIRKLHQKIQELTAGGSAPMMRAAPIAPATTPKEEELVALSEALEMERQQLREDEEALSAQMREMELQMSRERAELARQRHELQRLHADIERELENSARDAILRERLMPMSRRYLEMTNRKVGDSETPPPATQRVDQPTPPPTSKKDSSLLRRLFGG